MPGQKRFSFASAFLFSLLYGTTFLAVQYLLFHLGALHFLPSETTLNKWDAGIYKLVADRGYYYDPSFDDTGVFALFPYVWRMLHLGYVGMGIANYVIFSFGFAALAVAFSISWRQALLFLSLPSLYFMHVPYSEAVFFSVMSFAMLGIKKNLNWLVWVALFVGCFARATAVFLLPSLLVAEALSRNRKDILFSLRRYLWLYALPIVLGTAGFILLQYFDTGRWLPYYTGQVANLGHQLSMPLLPFSDFYGGKWMLLINAAAFMISVLSLLILVRQIYRWLTGNIEQHVLWTLALGYTILIMLTMVFANPKWGSGTTNLFGIHRYIFCAPFVFVFIERVFSMSAGRSKAFLFVLLVCNTAGLCFGSYIHIQEWLFFSCATLFLLLYVLCGFTRSAVLTVAVSVIGFVLQVALYQHFLSGAFTD